MNMSKTINNLADKIEEIISKKFKSSDMSNSKWDKLLKKLTDIFEEVHVNLKLIYDEKVEQTYIDIPDIKPFFIEPILYKEVEWIEFPSMYEDYISRDNLKAGKRIYSQDIKKILKVINSIGKFKLDSKEDCIKIYAYK